ncbi:MAG: GAF domain-containing protein [Actinobacteria bacterium]|jgi:signal transduction protein with GAF and PtsI domain|nr:MAG: GAF domain-containing protein [Actinomycetota bacterium]
MKEEERPVGEERYLEKIKELDLIWRINEQIMSFESLDSLLGSILEGALEIMEATSGSIMLIEPPGSDKLVIKAAQGLRKEVVNKASCKVGEGIAGLVAERREGMLLLDDLMDSRLRTRRKVTDALSVPIVEEGELLGVLNLNTKRDKAFGELDLFILNTLIKQVASAIVRGNRLEEIRLRLLELEGEEKTTLEDMRRLTAELDDKRRYYQRLRQQLDKLYRDLASLTGPVA